MLLLSKESVTPCYYCYFFIYIPMLILFTCFNVHTSDVRQFQNESRNFDVCHHVVLSIIVNTILLSLKY